MRGSVFVILLISLACAAVYAQGTLDQDRTEILQGKIVRIRAEPDLTIVSKAMGIQVLGDRSFVVCEAEDEHNRTTRTFVPVDRIVTLTVYESMDAARGHAPQSARVANISGTVTLKGKPVVAKVRLQNPNGTSYPTLTNEQGKYQLSGLPLGSYTVTISGDHISEKYGSVSKPVLQIDAKGGENSVDFSLD